MHSWLVSLPDRLDVFLAGEGRLASRAKAQQAIGAGLVLVNDAVIRKPAERLQEGDQVTMTADAPRSQTAVTAKDLHLTVLFEDTSCMVLSKPAGIAVHPGAGMLPEELTLLHGIAHLFQAHGLPFAADCVLVHRLDRDTTGCLLVAKSPEAHRLLQRQFEERRIQKFYLALVAGVPSPAAAVIDAPIGRATFERTKMAIVAVNKTRDAKTTYRTLGVSAADDAAMPRATLLLCELHTGRTHQLRVHLSAIGYPILGDATYTSTSADRLAQIYDIRTLCLHAWKLTFHSPADGTEHTVSAPLPPTFQEILRRLGLPIPHEH